MMNTNQFVSNARMSFAGLRWQAVVATAVLPFTFARGHISSELLVGAVPVAATWLASLLLAWRTRNEGWFAISFVTFIFGSRIVGVQSHDVPWMQFLQWLCYVVILAGAPLLFFPHHFRHFARLDQPDEPPDEQSPV